MPDNSKLLIRYAVGRSANFGKAENKAITWKQFRTKFAKPVRTGERFKDYLKLPHKEQIQLKAVNGWLYRTQIEGRMRNRGSGRPSDLISLDFDYATPEFFDDVLSGRALPGWELFVHTSRRHTDENPRFRIFIPVSEPIPNDFYIPVSRIICSQIDREMIHVDPVSFRPAQMMFMPTASKDGEYVFHQQQGELLDWSAELDDFSLTSGDWHDISKLPKASSEANLRDTAEKAEDPTEKQGVVGNFCRAYDVVQAIDAFELPYEPVTEHSGKPRYTYTGGTTTNGAEVQDDGLFLYSHHGSDPCSDMLVNAFDLVRLHKFSDADKDFDGDGKKITQWPSFKAMVEFIEGDSKYRDQVVASRYDLDAMQEDFDEAEEALGAFAEVEEDYDPEIAELAGDPRAVNGTATLPPLEKHDPHSLFLRPKRPAPEKDWIKSMELTQDGKIVANAPNAAMIVQNDLRTRNSLAFNEHTRDVVLISPLTTKMPFIPRFDVRDRTNGDTWEDIHDISVRLMIESQNGPGKTGYGFKISDRDLRAGIESAARKLTIHPVQEYLTFCERKFGESSETDPMSVAESLWTDYCASPDDEYHREASRLFLLACVARIFEPGHKFDFVPILHGPQGMGKSTMTAILARDWHGEIKANFDNENKLVEQMRGVWIGEIPELSGIGRSQIEDVKAFVSGTETRVRLAYDRRVGQYHRQTCFIGSTNDEEFLIDHTGNRRWWPIEVRGRINNPKLRRDIDMIWGAVTTLYRQMREEQPTGSLPLYLQSPESIAESERLQIKASIAQDADLYAEKIADYLNARVDPNEYDFGHTGSGLKHRERVTVAELATEVFEWSKVTAADARALGRAIRKCGWQPFAIPQWIDSRAQKAFYPGKEVVAQWEEEDSDDEIGHIV